VTELIHLDAILIRRKRHADYNKGRFELFL
jgi:hypothetical protein